MVITNDFVFQANTSIQTRLIIRAKPNAAPVREIVRSFSVTALVEIKRFSHVRWLKALIPSGRT